jgi:hypothetical protein
MVAPAEKKAAEPAKDAPAGQDQQVLIEEEDAFEEFAAQQTGAFFHRWVSRPPVMALLSLSRARQCARLGASCAQESPCARASACNSSRKRERRQTGGRAVRSATRSRRSVVVVVVVLMRPPPSPQNHTQTTVTDEAVVEEEANEALWQADWDDEDTSAEFQTRLKAELAAQAAK